MLVGRWLQRRVLDRNRQFLLEGGGADGLLVRRRALSGAVDIIPAPHVESGDFLLVTPGELVPVACVLESAPAAFSLDWINGEPHPRTIERSAEVPAGAFNAGRAAAELRATQSFRDSPLPALLAAGARKDAVDPHTRFFTRLARLYVLAVLALASLGFLLWLHAGVPRAIDIAAAILVVTCPCAIGLAIPLADELTLASLRRQGLLVRSADLFDRLARVGAILFDKTGTLTLGRLELVDRAPLAALTPEARDAAYEMVVRSNHPVSRCLAPALSSLGGRSRPGAQVLEEPGAGLAVERDGAVWRLGTRGWATQGRDDSRASGGTFFSKDRVVLARLQTREAVRAGTAQAIAALQREGNAIWLVSGDSTARVQAFATELGIAPERVRAEVSPEGKARIVKEVSAATPSGGALFIGDGVNDSLAFDAALCAGTPALDRPVMPGKADFLLLGEDLSVLPALFSAARCARSVSRRILALAFAYNALAIAVSLAGFMTPLAAAIAMPASSISILLYAASAVSGARTSKSEQQRKARDLQEARA
jgi:Cu2+-exporting ATPase